MDNEKQVANRSQISDALVTAVRTVAADSDLKVAFAFPKDATIRFIGQPILALNPATNNGTLPATLLGHPLIRGRYFFALPQDVWDQLYDQLGKKAFAHELVELELAASSICKDCSSNVGLRSGSAFFYLLLRSARRSSRTADETEQDLNANGEQAKLELALDQAEKRLQPLRAVSRGYAGWLLTGRQFLEEHDTIFSQWSNMVQRWGLTNLGILLPTKGMFLPGNDPTADPNWPDYSKAFEEFFLRWRLQGMAAPYLPIPLQPLMAGNMPVSVLPQMKRAGGVFCLPDTFPVPSRDELRNLLEPVLHGSSKPDHLAEWMEFVAKDNTAKRPIARFGRLFELQHYYRILNHRHHTALRGKSKVLTQILAGIFKTSNKTIGGDLRFIRKRLGKDWLARGQILSTGPF